MLNENYKNALKGFKAQGTSSHLCVDCVDETQHIYRIIMTENVPISDIDEAMLESFLEREKSGEVDYSKSVDHDGLKYVDLEQDVEIYPCVTEGVTTFPIEGQKHLLSSIDAKAMLNQLSGMGCLPLLTNTMQSLAQRLDGTQLQTAFPSLNEVKTCIDGGLILPPKFIAKINEWEALNCSEINFDFVEK
ncbi:MULTISPECIES: hypothetical protein [unclassified Pseudoalteromonas]|uniref:hypothetical protein n=1 Tax=unclassified Pseudoalteromonas TaxID=194690 RepID=UPI0004241EF7|nr:MULTISPECIES: hypothetical protein [unclassified Pseudoalteromonas]